MNKGFKIKDKAYGILFPELEKDQKESDKKKCSRGKGWFVYVRIL